MRISIYNKSSGIVLSDHDTRTWALQLNIMLSAGVPLLSALESMAKSELPRLAPACEQLAKKLEHGHSLSSALDSMKPVFNDFVIGLVVVGENTGKLAQVMERASDRAGRQDRLRREFKAALAYPSFLALTSLSMAGFMAFYMFPRLVPFLQGLSTPLPGPTRLLLWLNESFSSVILVATILVAWIVHLAVVGKDPRVERLRVWLLQESPFLGKLNLERGLSNVLKDLSLLMEAGCDLLTALRTIRTTSDRHREQISGCLEALRAGSNFSEAAESSGLIPPRFSVQIRAAEEVGELACPFRDIAEVLDESVNLRLSRMIQFAEPAILVFMGLLTGFVVLATFMPLYSVATAAI